MKKLLSLCMTLLLVLSLLNCQSVLAKGQQTEVVEGELVVSFIVNDTVNASSLSNHKTALEELGLEVKESLLETVNSKNNEMGIYSNTSELLDTMGSVFVVKYNPTNYINSAVACKKIKAQLEDNGYNVKYVEPNYIVKAVDLDYTAQYTLNPNQEWNYTMINAPEAWNTTIGSSSVKIAVVDTGIDMDHSCLEDYIDTTNSTTYVETSADDGNGHGTHVAGTIASYGTVSGVMRVGSLIAVRVLDASGSGTTTNVMNGIIYAADAGADVINMSLGGGSYSSSMQDACTYAYNSGTVVVAATGNEYASTVSYPAAYDNVIGVGAVTSSGTRASYSNYGTGLDVMAPGSSIYSTYMGGGFDTLSGTSMATPHVAGLAGLLKAANSTATVQQIMDAIDDTAVATGTTTQYGNGIIDCEAAVAQITGTTPTDPVDDTMNISTSYNKSKQNYYQYLTITDSNGNAISGANISVSILAPNGATFTKTATTDSNGEATISFRYKTYGTGTYTFNITVTKTGYVTATLAETQTVN